VVTPVRLTRRTRWPSLKATILQRPISPRTPSPPGGTAWRAGGGSARLSAGRLGGDVEVVSFRYLTPRRVIPCAIFARHLDFFWTSQRSDRTPGLLSPRSDNRSARAPGVRTQRLLATAAPPPEGRARAPPVRTNPGGRGCEYKRPLAGIFAQPSRRVQSRAHVVAPDTAWGSTDPDRSRLPPLASTKNCCLEDGAIRVTSWPQ
jgi:hypothetical protein